MVILLSKAVISDKYYCGSDKEGNKKEIILMNLT